MSGAPHRRLARPRPAGSWGLSAALVLLLAALVVGLTRPAGEVSAASGAEAGRLVTHVVLACPPSRVAPHTRSTYALGVAAAAGLSSAGTVTRSAPGGTPQPVAVQRGDVVRVPDITTSVLSADGPLAAGLFGFRVDESRTAGTQAVSLCAEPSGSWWFTGGGAGLDHTSQLVLTNVDEGPAVVDLRVLGPGGVVPTVGTRGLTIGPGQTTTLALAELAPQTDELAVGVEASRGRVVAALSDAYAPAPAAPPGHEWLDGRARPSRVVRLAGLPAHADRRTLLVANPSTREAVLDVRVKGQDGSYVPTGIGQQRVPPGAVRTIDLGHDIGARTAAAVMVRSQVRVLATVRSLVGGDTADAAAAQVLTGPAAAPVLGTGTSTVQLTAGALAAKVEVTAYGAHGRQAAATQVNVPASSTTSWAPPRRTAAYVVVTPLSGRVSGAVVYRGAGVSTAPLVPLSLRYLQPAVVPALR